MQREHFLVLTAFDGEAAAGPPERHVSASARSCKYDHLSGPSVRGFDELSSVWQQRYNAQKSGGFSEWSPACSGTRFPHEVFGTFTFFKHCNNVLLIIGVLFSCFWHCPPCRGLVRSGVGLFFVTEPETASSPLNTGTTCTAYAPNSIAAQFDFCKVKVMRLIIALHPIQGTLPYDGMDIQEHNRCISRCGFEVASPQHPEL